MHFSAQNIDSPSTRQSHSEEAVGPIKCPEGHCDWTGKVQSDLKFVIPSFRKGILTLNVESILPLTNSIRSAK